MREIKFRAFYEDMVYEVTEIMWSDGTAYLYEPSEEDEGSGFIMHLEDIKLLQFTGLRDKNGQEIFEGDVVKVGDSRWETRWDAKDAAFWFVGIAAKKQLFNNVETGQLNIGLTCDDAEIIGSIYQDPELLS